MISISPLWRCPLVAFTLKLDLYKKWCVKSENIIFENSEIHFFNCFNTDILNKITYLFYIGTFFLKFKDTIYQIFVLMYFLLWLFVVMTSLLKWKEKPCIWFSTFFRILQWCGKLQWMSCVIYKDTHTRTNRPAPICYSESCDDRDVIMISPSLSLSSTGFINNRSAVHVFYVMMCLLCI